MARFSADATGRFLRSRPPRSQRTCIVVWHGACAPAPSPHLFCKSMIPRDFKSNNLQEYHCKAVIFEFPQEYQSRIFKPRFSGNSALPAGEQLHPSQARVIANLGAETSGKAGQNAGAALLYASHIQCYRGGKPRSTGCSVHNKNRCGKPRAPRALGALWPRCKRLHGAGLVDAIFREVGLLGMWFFAAGPTSENRTSHGRTWSRSRYPVRRQSFESRIVKAAKKPSREFV